MESKRVITDANKVPLGRPPVNPGISKPSGSSLLKPSYLMGDSNSYSNTSQQPQPLMSIPTQAPGQSSSTASISFDLKKHHYEYEQYFNIINSTSTTTFNTYPNMPNSNSSVNNYATLYSQQIQQQNTGGPKMSTDYSSWSEPSSNSGPSSALVKVSSDYSSLKRGNEGELLVVKK